MLLIGDDDNPTCHLFEESDDGYIIQVSRPFMFKIVLQLVGSRLYFRAANKAVAICRGMYSDTALTRWPQLHDGLEIVHILVICSTCLSRVAG